LAVETAGNSSLKQGMASSATNQGKPFAGNAFVILATMGWQVDLRVWLNYSRQ